MSVRILLLGANGQVGFELQRALAQLGELVMTTRTGELPDGRRCEALDLYDGAALTPLLERARPDMVVNAAAYTAVDRAEDEPELAFRANAGFPGEIARYCAERDARLVHYSTDYVFDGTSTSPYRESDTPAPLGVYGASKLAGEQAIRESGARHLILRTAWVYATRGHNFLRTMLRLGAERGELRVVADQRGTPTPAWLVADVTAALLSRAEPPSGIRHLTATGETSRHGFAEAIFEEASARGLIERCPHVVAIGSAEHPARARRPAYSVLDTGVLSRELGHALPDWRAALSSTLARLS